MTQTSRHNAKHMQQTSSLKEESEGRDLIKTVPLTEAPSLLTTAQTMKRFKTVTTQLHPSIKR